MATKAPTLNYYEILGLRSGAGPAEIESAYRAGIVRFRDQPGGGEQTRRISLAYRALSNPERRREYDASLGLPPFVEPPAMDPLTMEPPAMDPPAMPMDEQQPFEQQRFEPASAPREERLDEREPAYAAHDGAELGEDQYLAEEQERPAERRGRGALLAIWAVALGLVALLAMFAGGMFDRERQVASNGSPAPAASGSPSPGGASNPPPPLDGTQLADAGPVPTTPGEAPATPAPQPVTTVSSDGPVSHYYGTGSAADEPGGAATDDAAETAPAKAETPAASDSPAANADVAPPQLPAAREEPSPAPAVQAPAPDRSAQARLLGGGLVNADNVGGRFQGTVGVRIAVGPNGRASGCQVTRSSGNGGLDATTCRLLQQRLQFSPARDRDGNPTTSVVESTHVWGRRPRR